MLSPAELPARTRAIDNNRRANHRTMIVIALMVIAWLVVVLGRNTIRAHWWAHQLSRARNLETRMAYFHRLAGLGGPAFGAASSMFRSNDAAVRGFAVAIANHVETDAADDLLFDALSDPDPNVRRTATIGLSVRTCHASDVDRLRTTVTHGDPPSAPAAVVVLAHAASDSDRPIRGDALAALIDALDRRFTPAVRAQAAQSLGTLEAADAIDALIDCLNDDTLFTGPTENERFARIAFSSQGDSSAIVFDTPRTIAQFASAALRRIDSRERLRP